MKHEVRDKRNDNPIFIHSELDDYGLTPIEFRAYARLSRRCGQSGATESLSNMAKGCKVSIRSLQLAIKLLCLASLIELEERAGRTNIIYLLPRSGWEKADTLDSLRRQVISNWKTKTPAPVAPLQDSTPAMVADPPCKGCTPTPATLAPKGTPIEGTPFKESKSHSRKRAKPASGEKDPRSEHPAILSVQRLMKRYPDKLLWDGIIERLGDDFDAGKLEDCRKVWLARGYNPNSLVWIKWYAEGIPSQGNGKPAKKSSDEEEAYTMTPEQWARCTGLSVEEAERSMREAHGH